MNYNYHIIPDYVRAEAERVSSRIAEIQKPSDAFTFAAVSDFHYPLNEETRNSALHAMQAVKLIRENVRLDAAIFFGDYLVGGSESTKAQSFIDAGDICGMIDFAIGDTPQIRLNGNHDMLPHDDENVMSAEEQFSFIGRYNKNTVTDPSNPWANYGFMDFPKKKLRFIYTNTSDIDYECHDERDRMKYYISEKQFRFIIRALDLTDKEDASGWASIILTHFPVDWPVKVLRNEKGEKYDAEPPQLPVLLDDYVYGRRGSIKLREGELSYDFRKNNISPILAAFNGHTHCFKNGDLCGGRVPRITIPNATFGRENEYGQNGNLRFGESETYRKELGTKDTSFNIVTIDRVRGNAQDSVEINCVNYGAGYDRSVIITENGIRR